MTSDEKCAVCRDPIVATVPPKRLRGAPAEFICVHCWCTGDGKEYWESHRAGAGHLVVSHRTNDGTAEPLTPDDVVKFDLEVSAEEIVDELTESEADD